MEKTIDNFEDSIKGIRLGTVTPSFIDTFKVSYYGQLTPIKHLAATSSDKGLVLVKPHDPNLLGTIQKTLKEAGLNAYVFSKQAVAVSVPPFCGEEREKIKARVKKLGEEAKIAIRNIRQNYRKSEKAATKDIQQQNEKEIQELTDIHIDLIDEIVKSKMDSLSK